MIYAGASRQICGAALLLTLMSFLVPIQAARADIGAKPSMTFEFVYESDAPLTIVEGQQLQCQEPTCADAEPLEELGLQGFRCTETSCSSRAYGYSTYNRLTIRFSDGVTRASNVFETGPFQSEYRVNVQADHLVVERIGGHGSPTSRIMLGIMLGGIVGGALVLALGLAVLVITVWLIVRARRGKTAFAEARGLFIAAWVASVPLLGLSAFLSPAPLVTVVIEGVVVLVYAALRRQALFPWLTQGLLVNMITQPALWLVVMSQRGSAPYVAIIAAAELAIWLVEAALLSLLRGGRFSFQGALALSLILNAVSLSAGLLLPV